MYDIIRLQGVCDSTLPMLRLCSAQCTNCRNVLCTHGRSALYSHYLMQCSLLLALTLTYERTCRSVTGIFLCSDHPWIDIVYESSTINRSRNHRVQQ